MTTATCSSRRCSAPSRLYISYQGFSAQDNSDKVPSVLLAELIDYVRQGFVLAGMRSSMTRSPASDCWRT